MTITEPTRKKKNLGRLAATSLVNQVSCDKREGQNVNAVVLFYSSTGTRCHEKLMGLLSFTPKPKWKFKPQSERESTRGRGVQTDGGEIKKKKKRNLCNLGII